MPAYISLVRIDWHVVDAAPDLLPAIAKGNANLDSTDHTATTFEEQLTKLVAAHPALVVDALIDDGYNAYMLFQARDGRVRSLAVEERPEGATGKVDLPYDDLPELDGDDEFPTDYDSEAELRDYLATISGTGRAVVTAGYDRFLVELEPEPRATKLVVVTEPELVARLLRADTPGPPRAARDPDQKYSAALYFPEAMLRFVQDHATRCDRSLSYIVQVAWRLAREKIGDSRRDELHVTDALAGGDKRKQTLYFPGGMLDAIEAEAMRLDSSQSFVAQIAVSLAYRDIEGLPTAEEFDAPD